MTTTELKRSFRLIDAMGAAACLALTAVVFVLGIQPVLEQGSQIQHAQAELIAERNRAHDASRSLTMLREQVLTVQQAVAHSPLRLQPLDQLNARLSLITALAAQHAVHVERLEPGRPSPQSHFATVPIRVGGRGGYAQIARFLHELHMAAPDTAVAAIDLRGQPRIAEAPALFDLQLVWHAAP